MFKKVIVVLVDHVGRRLMGEAISNCEAPSIKLKNPLVIKEVVGQDQRSVHLNISPVFHTFDLPEKEVKWTTKFIAPKELVADYERFVDQIKAKRSSNLEVVGSLPTNLPQVGR